MAKLDRIAIGREPFGAEQELRLDWSNDRHHAINAGNGSADEVIKAVEELLMTLKQERFYGNI